MGLFNKFLVVLISLCVVIIAIVLNRQFGKFLLPPVESGYFGLGSVKPDNPSIVRFAIEVSNETLQDLKNRLQTTKFFEPLEESAFHYGFNPRFLKQLQKYWINEYNWKKQQLLLNSFAQYRTELEGLQIHYLHVKPPPNKYKKIIPLMIVHGWPGSVYEFYKLIPMLTDPAATIEKNGLGAASWTNFAFEVIAPSIPGYGWSEKPKKKGFSQISAARIFGKLMKRLNFEQYYVHGGDWGAMIIEVMSQMHSDRVIGCHTTMPVVHPLLFPMSIVHQLMGSVLPFLFNPVDYHKIYPMGSKMSKLLEETGYLHIQATKPDTVAVGLYNCPVALAAYILEKFSTWTNPAYRNLDDGGLERHFTKDELITSVMVYWVTESIFSSQRFYKECFSDKSLNNYLRAPITVPTGVAMFPHELALIPENILTYRYRNISRYTDMPRGGHFAAFEEPKLLAAEIFAFVKELLSN